MLSDHSSQYAELTDDELLHLASDRKSLTDEAVVALDTELRRRNLNQSDQREHLRFAHRMEQREFRTRRRKIFGKRQFSWRELLSYFAAVGLIFFVYFELPSRYRLKPEWQDAAVGTMLASVMIVVGWRSLWHDIAYWIALILSSFAQLIVVHACTVRVGELSRGAAKGLHCLGSYSSLPCMGLFGCSDGSSTVKQAPTLDSW